MTELKEETEPMEVIEKQSSTEIKNVNYVIVNPTSAEKFNHGGDDGTGCECHTAVPKQLKGPNETSSGNRLYELQYNIVRVSFDGIHILVYYVRPYCMSLLDHHV